MAAFINGGGDLIATTLEQAFLELFWRLNEAEKAQTLNLGIARKTAWTADLGNQTVSFAATNLPIATTVGAGAVTLSPLNYLGGILGNFDPGGAGSLTATHLAAALVECASLINNAELNIPQTIATNTPHTTVVIFDENTKSVNITSTLPIETIQDPATGGVVVTAMTFLP